MNLNDYINLASQTAIYPNRGSFEGLEYCVMGLVGEVGEVYNVLKKCIRDDNYKLTDDKKKRLRSEMGDIMWYSSQIFFELQTTSEYFDKDIDQWSKDMVEKIPKFADHMTEIDKLRIAFSPVLSNAFDCIQNFDKIKFDGISKEDTDKLGLKIANKVLHLVTILIIISNMLDIPSFEIILQDNLNLLNKRKDEGKLKGSGEGLDRS